MLTIKCPNCEHQNDVDGYMLPDSTEESEIFECYNCKKEFEFGFYVVLEVR